MNILQLKASDPELSTWVSASAGTGKTKILTDRVLRLLLQNVSFDKILCLTFTNAASGEMHERIISNLEKWSKLPAAELQVSLKNTLGREPSRGEILKASSLFESYLKTQDQINIYTIHSFCQKILKKFPLEAGISPNFKIIDEFKVYQIIKKIKRQIFSLPDIEPIARFFAENFHELTINEIFNEIIEQKTKLSTSSSGGIKRHPELTERHPELVSGSQESGVMPYEILCVRDDDDLITHGPKLIEELSKPDPQNYSDAIIDPAIKELILGASHPECAKRHPELVSGSPKALLPAGIPKQVRDDGLGVRDDGLGARDDVLSFPNNKLTNNSLRAFFLTNDGSKKKRIVTKNIASPESSLYLELEIIQEKIYQFDQEAKTRHLILYSKLLSLIAAKIISKYEIYKHKNALLDYDDLIIYTQNLLTNSYAKEWVLYKLDGGIDHLLVDEAQDTSKNQWRIIEALIEEFYSGESNNSQSRTIFVVGDEKQSIFSFQGADISSFSYMNKFLHEKLTESKKTFETINLDISYRSTKEILALVNNVFNKIIKNNPADFRANLPEMSAHRSDHNGCIEFWPLALSVNKKDASAGTTRTAGMMLGGEGITEPTQSAKIILAEKIAIYVKNQINSGKILPSTKQKISAGDFMILFRTRDEFTNEVIKELKKAEIDISGLDRIALIEDLGVVDLLSIAKFVINPENDLNLAALLKSPIFGMSEEELYDLAVGGREYSHCEATKQPRQSHGSGDRHVAILAPRDDLFCQLLAQDGKYHHITKKLDEFVLLYKNLPLTDFFLYITDVLGYRDIITKNEEAIDEFLNLSKNYFLEYNSGLQNFIYWFEENEISIKRENFAKNKLRIMTTHGAKGLQAPIVILCDTTKLPNSTDRFIWDHNNEMFSAKSSSYIPEFYQTLKDNERQKAYQEYLRLLYVGLTRAEDQLIICGYQGSNQIPENCWYNLVRKSMQELGTLQDDGNLVYGELEEVRGLMNEGYHPEALGCLPSEGQDLAKPNNGIAFAALDPRLRVDGDMAPQETKVRLPYKILNQVRDDVGGEIYTTQNKNSFQYGLVFHKILEDVVGGKNFSNLNTHPLIATLDDKLQQRIQLSLQKLMSNQEFVELLKYDVKTELTFGYKANFKTTNTNSYSHTNCISPVGEDLARFDKKKIPNSLVRGNDGDNYSEIKIGRIDLLIIQEDQVTIIDYKSDVKPMIGIELIPQSYLAQLAFYSKSIAEIYPNKKINCKILWLEHGTMQDVTHFLN